MAGAALVACLAVGAVLAAPAAADTLGGEQLARTTRTVSLQPGAQPLPDVWAETWILADATTGEVLAQKGSHVQRPPASTLKMLTALTVLPRTTPETTWVATERAATIYGERVGLKVGRTYTLDQLWYAVFLPSANDAAIGVAQANGGVRLTVRQMNEVAQELNARDTVAKNTSGLDSPGQVSSAYDLALIARAGLQRPDFATYAGTARATFPDVKGKRSHPIYTTNRLLLHGWKGMIGVKTGFTSRAGRTYVGAATRKGRTLLVTLMGIHESSETAARKLLQWGFANADAVTPIGTLVEPGDLPDSPVETTPPEPVALPGTDSGGATSAAGPTSTPTTISSAAIVGALVLAGVAGAAVLLRRRTTRPPGRHAA
jgi:serine-type D-Ala-D-Ala carboxypeptidase (penicillin-binding protein 5/6)